MSGTDQISGQNLAIFKKDGSIDQKDLATVKTLTFSGANLFLNFTDGKTLGYAISGISKIYFKPVVTGTKIMNTADALVSIYPNPAENLLNLKNLPGTGTAFWITGTDGSVKKNGLLNAGYNSLDISSLPAGIYILKINNHALKFVKQ